MRVEKREDEDTAPPLCYVEVCEEGGEGRMGQVGYPGPLLGWLVDGRGEGE